MAAGSAGDGLTAGVSLLLLAVLAAVGTPWSRRRAGDPGDATRTAQDVLASDGSFRLGVASLYVGIVLDIVVAWALIRVFAPVDPGSPGSRLVPLGLLRGLPRGDQPARRRPEPAVTGGAGAFGEEQLQAQAMVKVEAYHDIWIAALLLFGAHLVLARLLGLPLGLRAPGDRRPAGSVVAGAGYAFDTVGRCCREPGDRLDVTFVGEFVLARLARGRGPPRRCRRRS